MCGIAGIASDQPIGPSGETIVGAMLDTLSHRGPDGRGISVKPTAVLGHARLAIIDLDGGAQPIANEDGTIAVVCNGEIYNHVALRRSLKGKGHRFRTGSDAEVIVHLYEEFGSACTDHLRGMFALAVWDDPRRRLLLARDPMGIKPLYYALAQRRLVFGSTLRAVTTDARIDRDICPQSIHDFLTFHYVPSPRTILSGVRKLRPGERLVFANGAVSRQIFRDVQIGTGDTTLNTDEWPSMIRNELDQAVDSHLMADVPVGAFLSGGIDSGAVVASMSTASPHPVMTHTIGFDNRNFDERSAARALAERLGCDHLDEQCRIDPVETVERIGACFDEPFADPSAIATYWLSRMTRKRVKVALSGDGGDELFAGYSRYLCLQRRGRLRRVTASAVGRRILRAGLPLLGDRLCGQLDQLTADLDRAHYLNVAWFSHHETQRLLTPEIARKLQGYDPFSVLATHFERVAALDPLSRSQYVDMKTWLADGVLCKVDRTSMAWGLEVRVPMLDAPFVESMSRLPASMKIRARQGKFALREAMAGRLGREAIAGRKRGFEAPMDDWVRGPLRGLVYDKVLARGCPIHDWLNPDAIAQTWSSFESGRPGLGARFWAFLMLNQWLEKHARPTGQRSDHPTTIGQPASKRPAEPAGAIR